MICRPPPGYDLAMRVTASGVRTTTRRRRTAGAAGLAVLGTILWLLAIPGAESLATTTSVSVTQGGLTLTPSANPQAGSPVTITESGEVGVTSTLQVFAQLGTPCEVSEGQEVAGGAIQVDQRVIPAGSSRFSVASQFTPAAAGTFYICGYLDGSSGGTEEDQSAGIVIVVAPASPSQSAPAATRPPATNQSTATPCAVPVLARHSLAGAKHLLASAGCSLGIVLQPSPRGLRRERSRPGGKSLVLVVGSQFPVAGTKLRANQYVAIRLVLGKAPGPGVKAGKK
jgi:hypothetical protein